jgi:hypothetical protein
VLVISGEIGVRKYLEIGAGDVIIINSIHFDNIKRKVTGVIYGRS